MRFLLPISVKGGQLERRGARQAAISASFGASCGTHVAGWKPVLLGAPPPREIFRAAHTFS